MVLIQRGRKFEPKERNIFALSFLVFVVANGVPLYEAQVTLNAILSKLSHEACGLFSVTDAKLVIAIHLAFDLIVLSLLFRSPFAAKESCESKE